MRNRFSLLFVLLVTGFVAMPALAQEQQLSGGASFTERVTSNQYGPFVGSTTDSATSVPKRFGSGSSWRTFSEPPSSVSIAVKPSVQEPAVQTQAAQQTHSLPTLWETVQAKTQSPDSPWADVK
jgi:hypothetical protein